MSNQWCRRRGCASIQKFGIVESPGKIPENPNKITKYLGKIPENLDKMAPMLFDLKKLAPKVCRKAREDHFLGVTPQKRSPKFPRQLFWKVWKNFGKNALHPQEFARSYIYLSNDQQWFNNVLVHWHFCVLKVIWFKN